MVIRGGSTFNCAWEVARENVSGDTFNVEMKEMREALLWPARCCRIQRVGGGRVVLAGGVVAIVGVTPTPDTLNCHPALGFPALRQRCGRWAGRRCESSARSGGEHVPFAWWLGLFFSSLSRLFYMVVWFVFYVV